MPYPYEKGKATAVSVLMNNDDLGLDIFGNPLADDADLLKCGTRFMSLVYGCKTTTTTNALWHIIFTGYNSLPKIQQLLPTDGANAKYVRRGHQQSIMRATDH